LGSRIAQVLASILMSEKLEIGEEEGVELDADVVR
jgi:hypothetical protein